VGEPNPKLATVRRLNSIVADRSASTVERNNPKAKWRIGLGTPIHGTAQAHGPAIHSHGKAAVTRSEIHLLDAGHFALDEKNDEIASLILEFLAKQRF
jgi:hypothetical protein